MKKLTPILALAMIIPATAVFVFMQNNLQSPTPVNAQIKPIRFNAVEDSKGLTMEFQHGDRLQVLVEGDTALVKQIALVLENQILRSTNITDYPASMDGVKIKVVTPLNSSPMSGENDDRQTEYASFLSPQLVQALISSLLPLKADS